MVEKPIHGEFENLVAEKHPLESLINMDDLGKILDDFYKIAPFPLALLNIKGKVLLQSHWEPICTQFHRAHLETAAICAESDIHFNNELLKGDKQHILYRCGNGLYDAAAPIIIDGQHLGNFFIGQFLLELPDEEFFRQQAQQYGFEEEAYLEALSRVPVMSERDLKNRLDYLSGFAAFLGNIGLKELKQERAEQELQARGEFLDRIIEQSPFATWISDAEGTLQRANPALKKFLNLTDDQLVGKYNVLEDPLVERQGLMPLIRTVYEEGKSISFTCDWSGEDIPTLDLKGSNSVSIEAKMFPIHSPEGKLTNVVLNWVDITDRKRAEEALQGSEERYRGLIEGLNEAIYRMSLPDGRYEYFSPAALSVFGYSAKEFMGNPLLIQEITHPDFTDYFKREWATLLKGKVRPTYEYKVIDREGKERWIIQSNKAGFDEQGNIVSIEGICRDITARKQAEDELKKYQEQLEELVAARTAELESKNKDLETFTYSVSHDLKAPLRGIDGYSRLLMEEYGEKLDEEGKRFLENVRHSTQQMNQLIEDLLAYSRMERRDIQLVSIDLPSMLDALIQEREQDLTRRNITLKSNIPFQNILCDRESIRQILGNLLDNAIKFTRDETAARIEINGSETPDDWTLWVKDNGVGFDPKYHDSIFGIFQRLHRSEDYPGTGVGLAIAQKAMQRMGGRIWAEGELGKGAVFYVQVPKSNKSYHTKGSSDESQCE